MLSRGCCGSIHGRLSSIDEASSFFEKVQLHFQLADLLVELILFGVGLLAHLLAAVAEYVRQTGQRLLLPSPDLGRVDSEHLRDLGSRLVRLDGLHGHLGLQAGWVILAGFGHCLSFIFNAAHHLRKGPFRVQKMGSTTVLALPLSASPIINSTSVQTTCHWLGGLP